MAEQLHKRFSTEEVKVLLQKYLDEKVKLIYILEILNITEEGFSSSLKITKKTLMVFLSSTKEKEQPEKSARK